MNRVINAIALLGALASLAACDSFDHLEISLNSTPPVPVVVTYDQIKVPEGVAVIATTRPMSDTGVMSTDTEVQLNAVDSDVLGVSFALPFEAASESSGPQWTFVLMGLRVGSTTLNVRVDGDEKKQIPVTVDAQPH